MDPNQKDVLNRILALLETGREAVEHLVSLGDQPLDTSFPLALDILEMLSNVQSALNSFQEYTWRDDAVETLQAVVRLFPELTDAYEAENEEEYHRKVQDIYLVYLESHKVVFTQLQSAQCTD